MKDFCIIGSGISGATIANSLSKKYSLDVYDKARGVGGRSSNKKLNKNESFDHGVQYLRRRMQQNCRLQLLSHGADCFAECNADCKGEVRGSE